MGSIINPFNSPFGASKPEQLPLSSLAGKPAIGPGRRGRSKKKNGAVGDYDPTWLIGSDTPVISGATVTHPEDGATASSAYSDVITADYDTSDALAYIEFTLGADWEMASGGTNIQQFGLKNATYKAGSPGHNRNLGISINSTTIYLNNNLTSNGLNAITNWATPVANDVIGIAVDFLNNKVYAHLNGTWATTAAGGGDPSADGGIAIANGAGIVAHLYTGTNNGGDVGETDSWTYSESGLYTPTGYTFMT